MALQMQMEASMHIVLLTCFHFMRQTEDEVILVRAVAAAGPAGDSLSINN